MAEEAFEIRRRVKNNEGWEEVVDVFRRPQLPPPHAPLNYGTTRHRYPAFLGPNGQLYNVDYDPVKPGQGSLHDDMVKKPYDVTALGKGHRKAEDVMKAFELFPEVDEAESYDAYLNSVQKWAAGVSDAMGYIVPPQIMGRAYRRPLAAANDDTQMAGSEAVSLETESDGASWKNVLVPPEPNPHFYERYEEYEAAMLQWMRLCNFLPKIVPSVEDLEGMRSVKIVPAKEVFSVRGGLSLSGDKKDDLDLIVREVHPGYVSPYINLTDICAMSAKRPICDPGNWHPSFSIENMKKASVVTNAHQKTQELKKFNTESLKKAGSFVVATRQKRFNETGVNGPTISVEAKACINIDNVDTRVDWKQMGNAADMQRYALITRNSYEEIMFFHKNRAIYDRMEAALVNPHISDQQDRLEKQVANVFETARPFDISKVLLVLRTPIFLDPFTQLLSRPLRNKIKSDNPNEQQVYMHVIVNAVTPETFPRLIEQWDLSRDDVILGKLSYLIVQLLGIRGYDYLRPLTEPTPQNTHMFFTLCRCICFMQRVIPDIYPFNTDTHALLESYIKAVFHQRGIPLEEAAAQSDIFLRIFNVTYMNFLYGMIRTDDIRRLGGETELELSRTFGEHLSIQETFFLGLNQRSAAVSNYVLASFLSLFRIKNSDILSLFRSTNTLIQCIRPLCNSRFSHTQFACRQLVKYLLEEQSWRQNIFVYFMNSKDIIEDLYLLKEEEEIIDPSGQKTVHTVYKPPSSTNVWFVGTIFLEALKTVTDKITAQSVFWSLRHSVFFSLVEKSYKVLKRNDPSHQGLMVMTQILEQIVIKIDNLNGIVPTTYAESKKNLTSVKTKPELYVADQHCNIMIGAIKDLAHCKDPYGIAARASLLNAFRILMRNEKLFEGCMKEGAPLRQQLVLFCKDGKDSRFNKCAWKLFYELYEYHSGAVPDSYLTYFTDILGTTLDGTTVLINCLHYLGKIFNLYSKEQAELASRDPRRIKKRKMFEARSTEKDVRQFINFFKERSLFIKLHMIYHRFIETHPGAAFRELAIMYRSIDTLPECQKLLKDIQKNEEYYNGIKRVVAMFNESEKSMETQSKK